MTGCAGYELRCLLGVTAQGLVVMTLHHRDATIELAAYDSDGERRGGVSAPATRVSGFALLDDGSSVAVVRHSSESPIDPDVPPNLSGAVLRLDVQRPEPVSYQSGHRPGGKRPVRRH